MHVCDAIGDLAICLSGARSVSGVLLLEAWTNKVKKIARAAVVCPAKHLQLNREPLPSSCSWRKQVPRQICTAITEGKSTCVGKLD